MFDNIRIRLVIRFSWLLLLCSNVNGKCGSSVPESHDGSTEITFVRGDGLQDRTYTIRTPSTYDRNEEAKVILAFHGWGLDGNYYTEDGYYSGYYYGSTEYDESLLDYAEEYKYVIVGIDGLGGSNERKEPKSWRCYGCDDGIGKDGDSITTCIVPCENCTDNCYESMCDCDNRCGWTHCIDDDFQMIQDFVTGGDGDFEKSLPDVLCFDSNAVFAMGDSNGGVFTWNLAQDSKTAPLLAGIAPIIATPMCDYDLPSAPGTEVPVIVQVGKTDPTITAHNGNWPGTPCDNCVTNNDGDNYIFISSHKITSTWAKGVEGCNVKKYKKKFPKKEYVLPGLSSDSTLTCRTWCDAGEFNAPYAVDCAFDGEHVDPEFTAEAAMMFFDNHLEKNAAGKEEK